MPEWRDEIRRRLAAARLAPEREADIVDEIAQHLEDRFGEQIAAGVPVDAATAAAWQELDTEPRLALDVGRVERPSLPPPPAGLDTGGSFFSGLWQDTRYAVRRLLKRPGFALTAVATVALSIGPATTILGIADELFFRPPAGVRDPSRLFLMQFGEPRGKGFGPASVSYGDVAHVLEGAETFKAMAGVLTLSMGFSTDDSTPQQIQGQLATANFFEMLGVPIVAGRSFLSSEDATPGGVTSAILTESFARQSFGSATSAIGRTIRLNSVPFTVVGVVGGGFEGLDDSASHSDGPPRFWITGYTYRRVRHFPPTRWAYDVDSGPFNTYVVRMASQVPVAQTEAELRVRISALANTGRQGADLFKTVNMRMLPGLGAPHSLNTNGVDIVRQLAIVALILVLLGIANMANLLTFESLKVAREAAIRKALGASAGRLIQLVLSESLLLALAGAVGALGVALGIKGVLSDILVWGIGRVVVPIDWRLLVGTAALAVVTGIGFGAGPALLMARGAGAAALATGIRTEWPRAGALRQALASVQLALSLVLLIGALLFLVTLKHLNDVEVGFDGTQVTQFRTDLPSHGYKRPQLFAFYGDLLARLKRQPGIEHAAMTYGLPTMGGMYTSSFHLPADPTSGPPVSINYVSSEFFDVLRIPIVKGRAFRPEESFTTIQPSSVVLSGTAATALFGDSNPIGREVVEGASQGRTYTVIGVTGDTRWTGVTSPPDAIAYEPFYDSLDAGVGASLIVRSTRDVSKVVKSTAASLAPSAPLYREESMSGIVADHLSRQRLFAWVLGLLGGIGFFLAAIGLHGLVSQTVAERSREFGIRIAIGANRASIVRLVARQIAIVIGVGAAAGILGALATGRLIEASLFGVTARQPVVFGTAVGLMILVATAAIVGPTRRAVNVDPVSVLRIE